jgi:hypothetical protein
MADVGLLVVGQYRPHRCGGASISFTSPDAQSAQEISQVDSLNPAYIGHISSYFSSGAARLQKFTAL